MPNEIVLTSQVCEALCQFSAVLQTWNAECAKRLETVRQQQRTMLSPPACAWNVISVTSRMAIVRYFSISLISSSIAPRVIRRFSNGIAAAPAGPSPQKELGFARTGEETPECPGHSLPSVL